MSIINECEDAFVSEIINTNTVQNTVRRGWFSVFEISNDLILSEFDSLRIYKPYDNFMNWSSKVSKHTNLGSENSEMMMKSHYDVIGKCYVIILFLRFSAYTVKTVSKDSAEAIW